MVKFEQRLRAELVPEWEDAYCSYGELKGDLRRIKVHCRGSHYSRTGSLGLLKSLASIKPGLSRLSPSPRGASTDNILPTKRRTEEGDVYVTELLEPLSRSPQEKTFFARLDAQLTKVNKFFRKKEGEYIARAGLLEKQMLSLLHVQEDMARQGLVPFENLTNSKEGRRFSDMKESRPDMPLIPENEMKSTDYPMQTFQKKQSEKNLHHLEEEEDDEDDTDNAILDYIRTNLQQRRTNFAESSDLPELAIPSSTGRRSIVRLSPKPSHQGSRSSAMAMAMAREPDNAAEIEADVENQMPSLTSEKEFKQAKKLLRLGFVEFYRGLGLLSNFMSLNMTAFSKILHSYDKNTGRHLGPIYMKEVEASYFATSRKVHKLMNKVEDIFIKHFTDGVRKKAISQLRPMRTQGTHRTTFFTGLFTGCSIALFISFFFLVENKKTLNQGGRSTTRYLETVFPVFSTLMLIVLHVLCYAWNVYAWSKTRVNYPFVFGFSPGTELRYRQVLLLGSGLTVCLLGGMNVHIAVTLLTVKSVDVDDVLPPSTPAPFYTDVVPLILILMTLATLLLPFDVMYRSSRAFFLGCFRRLISAPFVKVILPDFFLGDQLTSQVLVFRNLQFMACFYPTGYFLEGADTKCDHNSIYRGFGYIVALLPFWWRFLQCLRRYYDEKDTHQLENAGKYLSAIVALGLRQAFSNHSHLTVLWVMSIVASVFATVYTSYWDLCVDWGLLNRHSRNKWLRDKIILKNKSLYFLAIGANCALRLVWMLAILQVDRKFGWNSNAFNVSTASLEILRRGIWNFFRIENEHLNNVGKYRAVKAVPLPFNDD